MKFILYIWVLFFFISITAQKTVIKEIDFNNQRIEIQFEDIDLLEITHTDEQKIGISILDYSENSTFVELQDDEKVITIKSSRIKSFQEELKLNKFCYEQMPLPCFKLLLPKGCNVLITFKNGNLISKKFNGELNLRLNTGDITLDDFKGIINVELYSGNVNASIKNTETAVLSKKGKISTNFSITDWQKTDISLKGALGIKNNLLTVQSINANIVLNSSTTQ